MGKVIRWWAIAAVVLVHGSSADAQTTVLPFDRSGEPQGVASCIGGGCHRGGGEKRIIGAEYDVWHSGKDVGGRHLPPSHSGAYATLDTQRSRDMVRNLGLKTDPTKSPECLSCHADWRPERSEEFLEDGVGCEACHGPAEKWLKFHRSEKRMHDENLAKGLFPTDLPAARAELCLSCHFGNWRRMVDHRMMGAGHPRLRFELSTYTVLLPQHWKVDEDYRKRGKVAPEPIKLWALGQAVSARSILQVIADPERNQHGIWPEFSVMDCYSCHHSIEDRRRPPRSSTGLGPHPGAPRLNDAPFLMLRSILGVLDADEQKTLRKQTRRLHLAVSRGAEDRARVARQMIQTVDGVIPTLEAWEVTSDTVRAIALSLITAGLDDEYRDYPSAEQAAHAIQALARDLGIWEPESKVDAHITSLLQASDPNGFKSAQFKAALSELRNDFK